MLVNADIYVKDIPGQLVSALEPMSTVNANIIGVVHSREQMVSGRIAVNLTFDIDPDMIDRLKEIWKSKDMIISRMGSVYQTYTMEYMLIGEFDANYLEGLINEASEIITMDSMDMRYSSKTTTSSKRTGMIAVKTRSEEDLDRMDSFLSEKCKQSNITYVRGV